MDIFDLMGGMMPAWLLPYASAAVAAASLIDAVFPQPAPGSRWWGLRQVITRLACNVGHASNANSARI